MSTLKNQSDIPKPLPQILLTRREVQHIYHLANGKSIPEIAAIYTISEATSQFYLNNIQMKLQPFLESQFPVWLEIQPERE